MAARPAVAAPRAALGVGLTRLLAESPGTVPAAFGVAIFVWFAADEAGFRGVTWYPATLLLLALLAVLLVALPRPQPSRLGVAAIGLIAAYAAWSYLTILWADQQGIAWDGANRTVFYALVVALFALWPIRARPAAVLLGAYGLGVAAVGLVELLRVAAEANPIDFMPEGRLTEPVGYANANVALWFSAFWPCAILAARREVPVPVRGLMLGGAALLLGLAVMGQSRAWFFTFPLAILIAVALIPGRARTIVTLGALGLGALLMLDPILAVYDAFELDVNVASQVDDATRRILLVSGGLALLGALIAALDRRVEPEPRTVHRVGGAVIAAFVLALGAGGIALVAVKGNPVTLASDAWEDFKEGGSTPYGGEARFSGNLDSQRYDYWRVAWDNFESAPLHGVGADNFGQDYLRRGNSGQQPTYPHSVVLRALSQTGLIGTLLLFGALLAGLIAAIGISLRDRTLEAVAAGTAIVAFAYWLLHGSFDWLWEFPGLGGPALGLLALGLALGRQPGEEDWRPRRAMAAAAATLAGLLTVSLTLPWLAERDLRKAQAIAARDPGSALERLDRSAALNPLAARPLKTAGLVLVRQGRLGEAEHEFRRALEREPLDAYSYLQLGAIASQTARREEAESLLARAHELAPRDVVIRAAVWSLRRGGELDVGRIDARIREDIEVRLGRR